MHREHLVGAGRARGFSVKVATTAAWSEGSTLPGSSVTDGSGAAAMISIVGRLAGLTRRWEA
jgi:hypothetical protein